MTRPEGAPRRPPGRKKGKKYVEGAEERREDQRWRDGGEEVKNHNVSHVDGGNFIKPLSSGV